jgi:hypothetical protein
LFFTPGETEANKNGKKEINILNFFHGAHESRQTSISPQQQHSSNKKNCELLKKEGSDQFYIL